MKKHKGKWIQRARARMKAKGTEGSYGHHTEKQMERDIHKGGKRGKKAQFALNMRKIAARKKARGSRRGARKG